MRRTTHPAAAGSKRQTARIATFRFRIFRSAYSSASAPNTEGARLMAAASRSATASSICVPCLPLAYSPAMPQLRRRRLVERHSIRSCRFRERLFRRSGRGFPISFASTERIPSSSGRARRSSWSRCTRFEWSFRRKSGDTPISHAPIRTWAACAEVSRPRSSFDSRSATTDAHPRSGRAATRWLGRAANGQPALPPRARRARTVTCASARSRGSISSSNLQPMSARATR